MAWKMLDRAQQEAGEWSGFLDYSVRVEGKLELPGTFRLDSQLRGSITSGEMLILGENSSVEGEIAAKSVSIAGRFEGRIQARGRVDILTKAIVVGDVETPCLVIEAGAMMDGRCHVSIGRESSKPLVIPIRSVTTRT